MSKDKYQSNWTGLDHARASENVLAGVSPQFSTISKAERSLVQTTFNMAATSGEVVFRAGENNDTSDIWDDTALIEAYDQAISAIKNGGKNSGTKSKTGAKNRKQQSTKKKDKKKATEQGQEWRVGDNCRAVYSEDELIYDAVIISLDASSNTCVVRFCGYGNKEEQNLDDLLPPLSKKDGKSPRHNGNQSGWAASPGHQSGDNDMDWTSGAQSPVRWQVSDLCLAPEQPSQHLHEAVINSFPTAYTCKVTFLRSRQRQDVDVSALKPSRPSRQHRHHPHHHHHPYSTDQRHLASGFQFPSYPFPSSYQSSMNFFPPPPPPPMPPTLLPQHWPIPNPSGFQPPSTTSTQFPFAPMPPPPAPVNSNDVSHDSDALASMLMAWYLSGYHTGYYQAMQNLRHGPNTVSNEAQVSTTDTNASKQDSAEVAAS